MNAGSIWWGQIGNSIRLLTKVTNNLRDCQSTVLQIPRTLPWRQDFYDAIDFRRTSFGGDRRMVRLAWEEGEEPGKFVLDELCSSRVRADYWPGQTYAEYLGARNDLLMNDYYVWIRDIHQKSDLSKWVEFVTQYKNSAEVLDCAAVFILEYDGGSVELPDFEKIVYTVESYDCRVFSLEAASTLRNTPLRNYQAELALCICQNNPELCFALLSKGLDFLQNPVQTTIDVLSGIRSSEGEMFSCQDAQQIQSSAWEASIVLLFPILEHYRMTFVENYKDILGRHLPISNSNGDRISDPFDLEIGSIHYIIGTAEKEFSVADAENIRLCRKARNLLAHNKPLPYTDVLKIVSLS